MSEEKQLYSQFREDYPDICCRGELPPCASACPFILNVRDFISKSARGSLDAAVKTFRDAVIFPRIVAQLCPAPCRSACPRSSVDSCVDLHGIEQAAVKYARSLDPINFNVPVKSKTVAVIGAGISGLACALRLAAKKYQVTVFEKSDRIGGQLWDSMDPQVFLEDIATQGKYVKYDLQLNREIRALDEVKDFDVVYIATGKGGNDFGLTADEENNPCGGPDGVFIGGSVLGRDIIWSIVDGANCAINMEKHIMTGGMKFPPEKTRATRIQMEQDKLLPIPAMEKGEDGFYTKEQAKAEAGRCLRCDCARCLEHCDFMEYWRLYPKQVGNFMAFGLGDMNLEPKSHNRMVNACTNCGVCQEVCPFRVENGDQMMAVRRKMFTKGMIPPAYHFYYVNDMKEALAEDAYLLLPGGAEKKYLFFPGCQLGASDPRYPRAAYELLKQVDPDAALLLTCCGAPAFWAGDQALHEETLAKVRQVWEELGKPTLVCACLNCLRMFRDYAPELDCISLYQVLADNAAGLSLPQKGGDYALADPCSAKFTEHSRESVQALLEKMGVKNDALYPDVKKVPCCGNGGHIYGADPGLYDHMVEKRVNADERPYITYCSNCRDIYAAGGKQAVHLLDLLAGLDDGSRKAPHISERRNNRKEARALLLNEAAPERRLMYELEIAPDVREHMDRSLIYDEDVCKVIAYGEENNCTFIDDDGNSISHLAIGLPTVWVSYKKLGEGRYQINDCYQHRMTVIEPDRDYSDCINNEVDYD